MQTRLSFVALACVIAAPAYAGQTYITDFTKTDNIYTNLNQQFPHTGTGTPGSSVGTANASYLFVPPATGQGNPDNVNNANNGINFELTSDAAGHDFAEVGTASFGVSSLTLPINVADADHLYLLTSAYNGVSFNITLSGLGGETQTFTNISLPDFNGGGSVNSVSGGVSDQTVFRVVGVGGGGTGNSSNGAYNNYDLTEIGLTLDPAFANDTLTSATITSNGYETVVLGATVTAPGAISAAPEPASWAMMIGGFGLVGGAMRRRRQAIVSFG